MIDAVETHVLSSGGTAWIERGMLHLEIEAAPPIMIDVSDRYKQFAMLAWLGPVADALSMAGYGYPASDTPIPPIEFRHDRAVAILSLPGANLAIDAYDVSRFLSWMGVRGDNPIGNWESYLDELDDADTRLTAIEQAES